jgi:hypothetical protein
MAVWKDFFALSPIPNSNEQTIIADSSGYYAVKNFDENNCSNESDPYHVVITGILSPSLSSFIHVFPNPVSGLLHVQVNMPWNEMQIRNSLGVLIHSQSILPIKNRVDNSRFNFRIGSCIGSVVKTPKGNAELKFVKL